MHPGNDGLQQSIKQVHVHHGHFIYDDSVCSKRILRIAVESDCSCRLLILHLPVHFQHPVYGSGFISRCFRHPLRGSSGRGCQHDIQTFIGIIPDNGIDRRRFSCSRSAGNDHDTVADTFKHRFTLQIIQHNVSFPFHIQNPLLLIILSRRRK